jgi:hypothetical protein
MNMDKKTASDKPKYIVNSTQIIKLIRYVLIMDLNAIDL